MRTLDSSIVTLGSASDLESIDTIFIQTDDPAEMQARVAVALAAHPNSDWSLSFIDLAGGGDGHTFVCTLVFATAEIGGGGTPPDNTKVFFYLASDASALATARSTVDTEIAALFSAPISANRVDLYQTTMAGSSKGTRFMGCVLLTFAQIT